MFFKILTKKTLVKRKTEAKYNFFFWNKFYGQVDESITHKLDYIPENWIATHFSALHPALVYDYSDETFDEFSYMNPNHISLQIKQMELDYTRFPPKTRNHVALAREYQRIRLLKKAKFLRTLKMKRSIFMSQIPNYTLFLATNYLFAYRRQCLGIKKGQRYYTKGIKIPLCRGARGKGNRYRKNVK